MENEIYPEEGVLARPFPKTVIFLESALMIYGYTDRIPSAWQIAVDILQIEGVDVKVFNRDRIICDVLRYESRLERSIC